MSVNLTPEQQLAIDSQGRVIVSASAGSGKTFVMIQKLVNLVEQGVDVRSILAVTFTEKAATQIKDKLRKEIIERLKTAPDDKRAILKEQLTQIPSAEITTIDAFCSHLLRTYFYAVDIDSTFDIMTKEDAIATVLKNRAMDNLFESLYDTEDEDFLHLLACYYNKHNDQSLRYMVLFAYDQVRNTTHYRQLLQDTANHFTQDTFAQICRQLHQARFPYLDKLIVDVESQMLAYDYPPIYAELLDEIKQNLMDVKQGDIFMAKPKLCKNKPQARQKNSYDEQADIHFTAFRDEVAKVYNKLFDEPFKLDEKEKELFYFLQSGKTAQAFAKLLIAFDDAYSAVKREESKLDFGDLEHYTLKLLAIDEVRLQLQEKFHYVYVDEYQDVNPVQEAILSTIGKDNIFLVGDIKQAIYGFRGSKSIFFAQKFDGFQNGEGQALKLNANFRSSDGVVNFVNDLFSYAMTEPMCGIDYQNTAWMVRGASYPDGYGVAKTYLLGKDDKQEAEEQDVYSVVAQGDRQAPLMREAKAVVKLVKSFIGKQIYDLELNKTGGYRPATLNDICVLVRKRTNDSAKHIVRALKEAGIPVVSMGEGDLRDRPEVKKLLDVLSYLDNSEQDIPLVSSLLTPLAGLNEEQLSLIRLAYKSIRGLAFRDCCRLYMQDYDDEISQRLAYFFQKMEKYRQLTQIFGATGIIDRLMVDTCWEAQYMAGNGVRLANIRRIEQEAISPNGELSLNAFLQRIANLKEVKPTSDSVGDSVTIMTQHSSKGLEFPIVILGDICKTYEGDKAEPEMYFGESYGFAPCYYDQAEHLKHKTVLRRLYKLDRQREEVKNEINLYYVACTRAKCELHVLASEDVPYTFYSAYDAGSFAQMTKLDRYDPEVLDLSQEEEAEEQLATAVTPVGEGNADLIDSINAQFQRAYLYEQSVNLPVKSSASAILRMQQEEHIPTHVLFEEEGERMSAKKADIGTAYHRFLQLCDFTPTLCAVQSQKNAFVQQGLMSQEQADMLNDDNLLAILQMPVFARIQGAKTYREREFICHLPANDFLDTQAKDDVMVQGAIDLLVQEENVCHIVDYKYSSLQDEALRNKYTAQLSLYKKVVATILKLPLDAITTTIVNIKLCREIKLDV